MANGEARMANKSKAGPKREKAGSPLAAQSAKAIRKAGGRAVRDKLAAIESQMLAKPLSATPYREKEALDDLAFLRAYRKRNP